MKLNLLNGIKLAVASAALASSLTVNASLIDNGSYVTDTVSGLDWLDLTSTQNNSYDDIVLRTSTDGDLFGWDIANSTDVYSLFDAAGGDGSYPGTDSIGSLYSSLITSGWASNAYSKKHQIFAMIKISDAESDNTSGFIVDQNSETAFYIDHYSRAREAHDFIGTALKRSSTAQPSASVPEPSIIALFGLGIFGLGLSRRKMKK